MRFIQGMLRSCRANIDLIISGKSAFPNCIKPNMLTIQCVKPAEAEALSSRS